jgi:hypothetical protein
MSDHVSHQFSAPEPEAPEADLAAHEDLEVVTTGHGPTGPTGYSVQIGGKDTTDLVRQAAGKVKAFENVEAMAAAWEARNEEGHRLVEVDPAYRQVVEARTAAAMTPSETFGMGIEFAGQTETAQLDARASLERRAVERALIQAEPKVTAEPFPDEDSMVEALSDPRYQTSEAFRRLVDARIAAM